MRGFGVRLSLATLIVCKITTAQPLPPTVATQIDEIAAKSLADTGTPSVSIAIAGDRTIVFEKAYGSARLDPPSAARPAMRYCIGSVSKQFLAGAILLLVQDHKLSLDDRVGQYLPDLTRANDITIRQLLNHTSGYQDYYPQDYVAPFMTEAVTPEEILTRWAKQPLDFDPGTRWQYSNTNYAVAGRVIEKVTGAPFFSFLSKRILQPLGMTSAIDLNARALSAEDASGYTRFALGPPRPATREGRGWLYAAGELAMTAHDLALWDISLMDHKLLTPASLETITTPVRLIDGAPTAYALGIMVTNAAGHPRLIHSGAVAGFVSLNSLWPDQGLAIVTLANMDGSQTTDSVTAQIAPLLLKTVDDPHAEQALTQARRILDGLMNGRIDRGLLSANANAYFTPQVLQDAASSLTELGPPQSFKQRSVELRGGMIYRHFEIQFKEKSLPLNTLTLSDGKLEQYLIQ
ncbi:MAG: beta-lactamase family protein [Acidobacteriaceae bacterium]|nr:beta-lactamase family protein [Acidobacteriaceae bacterium]